MKPKIDVIKIKHCLEENPDTSWLGEFTDKAEPWNICRHCGEYLHNAERGDRALMAINDHQYDFHTGSKHWMALEWAKRRFSEHDCPHSRREYNYFKPYAGGEPEGTPAYQEYGLQDHKRMEELNRGDFCFLGIMAEARISYPVNEAGDRRLETLTSGGIGGVESDCDDSYMEELEREQLDDLKAHLETFGVDLSNFDELAEEALEATEEEKYDYLR